MSNYPEEDRKLGSRKKNSTKTPEFYTTGNKLSEKFISLCFIIA